MDYRKIVVAARKLAVDLMRRMKSLKDLHRIMQADGVWNRDDYTRGVADGIEMAMSVMEDRDPVLKQLPSKVNMLAGMRDVVARGTNAALGHEPWCNVVHDPKKTMCAGREKGRAA